MKIRKAISALMLVTLLLALLAVPAFAARYEQDISSGVENCKGTSHLDGADSWNVLNAWKQYINRDSDSLEQGLIDTSLMVKWLTEKNSWIYVEYDCASVPIIRTQDSAENWSLPEADTTAYASNDKVAVFKMEDILADYTAQGLTPATWGNLSVRSSNDDDVLKVSKVVFYIGEAPDMSALNVAPAETGNTGGTTNTGETGNKENPKTGDTSIIYIAVAALALSGGAFFLLKKRANA